MEDFRKYSTIDEVMAGPGKKKVIEVLNSNRDYLSVVKLLGYNQIGINVLDSQGNETLYVSDNRPETGEIIDIYRNPENIRTNITVKTKDQTLMNMLYKMDWIEDNTLCAIFRYFPRFKFEEGVCKTVMKATRSVVKRT